MYIVYCTYIIYITVNNFYINETVYYLHTKNNNIMYYERHVGKRKRIVRKKPKNVSYLYSVHSYIGRNIIINVFVRFSMFLSRNK